MSDTTPVFSLGNLIRNQDQIVQPLYASLHGGSKLQRSTICGGILSILAKTIVFIMIIYQGLRVVKSDP